jgi:hypothetical protein
VTEEKYDRDEFRGCDFFSESPVDGKKATDFGRDGGTWGPGEGDGEWRLKGFARFGELLD